MSRHKDLWQLDCSSSSTSLKQEANLGAAGCCRERGALAGKRETGERETATIPPCTAVEVTSLNEYLCRLLHFSATQFCAVNNTAECIACESLRCNLNDLVHRYLARVSLTRPWVKKRILLPPYLPCLQEHTQYHTSSQTLQPLDHQEHGFL